MDVITKAVVALEPLGCSEQSRASAYRYRYQMAMTDVDEQ